MDPDMSRSMLAAAEKKAMKLGIRVAIWHYGDAVVDCTPCVRHV